MDTTRLRLSEYIQSLKNIDVSSILSIIDVAGEKVNLGVLSDELIQPLLDNAQSPDDVVAAATIIRLYANREIGSTILQVTNRLEGISLPNAPRQIGTPQIDESIKSVTLISAASNGAQLMVVYSYAIALLTQQEIEKIFLIFTGEWSWGRWCKFGYEKVIESLKQAFLEQAAIYSCAVLLQDSIGNRINIVLSPRPEEMPALLGDAIIRFEGVLPFNTTHIYGKSIHALRPVITAPFSSHVIDARNSDVLLVRAKPIGHSQVQYMPLASGVLPITPPSNVNEDCLLIVTVYSQDRIEKALSTLAQDEWDSIDRLFHLIPNAKWMLIGASNPTSARAAIPSAINEKFGDRIEVQAFTELDNIYRRAFAFLALPRVFGGGGGAALAISKGLPVIVYTDAKSDIANWIPEQFHVNDISQAISLIENWTKNPDTRDQFISEQQDYLAKEMDPVQKGNILMQKLKDVIKARHANYNAAVD